MNPLFAVVLLLCCRHNATGTQDHSDHECQSQGVRSCGECLAAGPHCAWCTEESFLEVGQHLWERCDTAEVLLRRGCPSDRLEDPRGSTVLLKNQKISVHPKEQRRTRWHTQVTQLQPQTVQLHLRPGEPQSFEVKFKRVEDYPVDLYYLMDLSFSMEDDLPNVKKLGEDLMEEMRNTTGDFRMGFGAFVDKTVMPYISTAKDMLRNPCKRTEPWPCTPPFTYRHVLGLTANGSLFAELVGGQRISGNLDSPEGGLDALMQAAVCEEQIGWRNVTRLLVFSTDAGFHFAGDGKLGGIVLPNDGKCHLRKNVYTKGNFQDYPSVAHVAETLRQKNIQIIFAVTEEVKHLYEGLRGIFPKCAVGTLSNNSHNILQIIVEAYNALTSEVVMENSKLPPGYRISYASRCKDRRPRRGEQGRRCSDISVGDEVSFNVSVTAPLCGAASPRPSSLIIKPQGYSEEVKVLLSPICECSCQKDMVPHSPLCSHGNGTLECGACRCEGGRVGTFCECDREETVDSRLCRRDNASEVCGGHGECVCGRCVCRKSGKKPDHVYYYGKLCECSDFGCDHHRGLMCGGHGRCVCGLCVCLPAFGGRACECPLSLEPCLSQDGQICGGRGDCHCGTCICHDNRFQGPTCELCPSCPGICTLHSQLLESRVPPPVLLANQKKVDSEDELRDCINGHYRLNKDFFFNCNPCKATLEQSKSETEHNRECVSCRAFSLALSPKECEMKCSHLNLTSVGQTGVLATVPPSPGLHRCMEVDTEGCRVHFLLRTGGKVDSVHVHVSLERECPSGPNVILITAVLSGSVVVLGVAVLLLWKLLTSIHDRREFARFQRELEQRRWNRRDNPIYKSAITTVVNPKYKDH